MKIPVITGTIRRRFLINFRVDPAVMQLALPLPFTPKLYDGHGVAGVCLIRLEGIRPKASPLSCGLSSENAAHRFAVQWQTEDGTKRSGVYIPRRDTDSLLNHLTGGRIFPGVHHRARFDVSEKDGAYTFSMCSSDGIMSVNFTGRVASHFPSESIFASIEDASAFFKEDSLGYSDTKRPNHYDGLMLQTKDWQVVPFDVDELNSSYFSDTSLFPEDSVVFDHALMMENIEHEWHTAEELCCKEAV